MPIRPPVLPAAALALAAFAASGCRPAHEALADAGAGPPSVPMPAQGRSAAAPAPIALGEDTLPLPGDFPDDVYLPPHYRISSVMDRGDLRVVSLQAPGRVAGLFGAASMAMRERGWKQTLAMQESGDSAILSYEKDRRAAVLSFTGGGMQAVTMSVQLRNDAP